MRKLMTLVVLFITLVCSAKQPSRWDEVKSVNFYGVDFSLAKVYGATEIPADFYDAFIRINDLFESEPDKYTVGKWIPKEIAKTNISVTYERNRRIEPEKIRTFDNSYKLTDVQVATAVKKLPVKETAGTGMVVIAGLLDKPGKKAYYKVVFFDIATRQIILEGDTEGKSGGFGLRNYWARSVYEALKSLKGDKFTLYMKEPGAKS